MRTSEGLRYTKEHEWVRFENGTATIGITDFAQHSLGEIVYADLPHVGDEITAGGVLGTVESVKSVSDVYSPVAGKVAKVNSALEDNPGAINEDPYGNGLAVLETAGGEPEGLMDAREYDAFCAKEE